MTDLEPFIKPAALTVTADDQVAYATARIREYCGWHIFPSITSTETLDCYGEKLLMLPTLHLTEVISVTLSDGDVLLVEGTDFRKSHIGVLERAGHRCWPRCFEAVTVVFKHGYEQLPDALREVAVGSAKRMPTQMANVKAEGADGVTRQYGEGWTFNEQLVLDRYRIPSQP